MRAPPAHPGHPRCWDPHSSQGSVSPPPNTEQPPGCPQGRRSSSGQGEDGCQALSSRARACPCVGACCPPAIRQPRDGGSGGASGGSCSLPGALQVHLAPWAGSCPIQSHGTAAFNTPTTGSRHGLSSGGDPPSSSPLRPLTEVTFQLLGRLQKWRSPFYFLKKKNKKPKQIFSTGQLGEGAGQRRWAPSPAPTLPQGCPAREGAAPGARRGRCCYKRTRLPKGPRAESCTLQNPSAGPHCWKPSCGLLHLGLIFLVAKGLFGECPSLPPAGLAKLHLCHPVSTSLRRR